MKKLIKTILIGLAAAAVFSAPSTYAVTDPLVVQFENEPLFSEANFLPGSLITRWTKVYNNSESEQGIIVEAINETDPDGLGDFLNIVIKEGGTELYSASLADFFDDGEVFLSNLSVNGNTQYDFSISFKQNTENQYQEKSLGFDILIGFEGGTGGDDDEGGFTTGGGGSTGGGGNGPPDITGSPYPYPNSGGGLSIQNDSVIVSDVQTASVLISWHTSYRSTSRVIYDTEPGKFNFSIEPNYGYSYSTDEFHTPPTLNGVYDHSVLVTGLIPDTDYYFRVISHASPPNISTEYNFKTKTPSEEQSQPNSGTTGSTGGATESSGATGSSGNEINTTGVTGTGEGGGIDLAGQDNEQGNENGGSDESGSNDGQSAALIFGVIPFGYFLALIVLLLLILLYLLLRKKKKKE